MRPSFDQHRASARRQKSALCRPGAISQLASPTVIKVLTPRRQKCRDKSAQRGLARALPWQVGQPHHQHGAVLQRRPHTPHHRLTKARSIRSRSTDPKRYRPSAVRGVTQGTTSPLTVGRCCSDNGIGGTMMSVMILSPVSMGLSRRARGLFQNHGIDPRPTLVMSCRARTRHIYDGTR
jgi:hypothetical protein